MICICPYKEPAAIVVRPPALTTAPAGQTVRLTCVAYGSPVPNITWTLGENDLADKVIEETSEVGETTFLVSVLQLCDITSADAAEYACTATNGVAGTPVADNSAKFFLSVSQPVTGESTLFHACCVHALSRICCCDDILRSMIACLPLKCVLEMCASASVVDLV